MCREEKRGGQERGKGGRMTCPYPASAKECMKISISTRYGEMKNQACHEQSLS